MLTEAASGSSLFSQSFAATTGAGVLNYQHGSYTTGGTCIYSVTFGPSNAVTSVTQSTTANLVPATSYPRPCRDDFRAVRSDILRGGPVLNSFEYISIMAP